MHSRLLVFDIETVPDRELLPEPSTGNEDPFPKPLHHQVIAIGFVSAQITRIGRIERYEVEECRSGGTLDSTEPELLRGFWALIEREKPRVVTWNGRTFDLPVLAQRALIHGIPMRYWHQAGDRWNTYRQRYALDWSCDLMDVLGGHGASKHLKLEETAIAAGLPGKLGFDGSQVAQAFAAGRLSEIRAYCETDVLNLYGLYLRWAYVVGKTDVDGYDSAIAGLMRLLDMEKGERPYLGDFLDRWRKMQRPIFVPSSREPPCLPSAPHIPSEHILP
jgi:predicted PolB exonuclease-like 3'-5' exonuclease